MNDTSTSTASLRLPKTGVWAGLCYTPARSRAEGWARRCVLSSVEVGFAGLLSGCDGERLRPHGLGGRVWARGRVPHQPARRSEELERPAAAVQTLEND